MNLLIFYREEVSLDGVAVLTGERRSHCIDRHDLRDVGIRVKAGILGGNIGSATVASISDEAISFSIECNDIPPTRKNIRLIIGVPRPQTVKKIIQVATSFGVNYLEFVSFQKTVKSYLTSKIWEESSLAFEKLEALEQVADTVSPIITLHRSSFEKLAKQLGDDFLNCNEAVVFDGRGELQSGKQGDHYMKPANTLSTLIFGPEAGFTSAEIDLFQLKNIPIFSLGERMLRLEHAVCAAIASLKV